MSSRNTPVMLVMALMLAVSGCAVTLNGTVMLSGFATSASERAMAESLARDVNGVRAIENQIAVRRP